MGGHIEELRKICRSRDLPRLISKLKEIVPITSQRPDSQERRGGQAGDPTATDMVPSTWWRRSDPTHRRGKGEDFLRDEDNRRPAAEQIHPLPEVSTEEAGRRKSLPRYGKPSSTTTARSRLCTLGTASDPALRGLGRVWRGNPVYEKAQGQLPIGWVSGGSGAEACGLIASVPFACHYQGRNVRGRSGLRLGGRSTLPELSMQLLDA